MILLSQLKNNIQLKSLRKKFAKIDLKIKWKGKGQMKKHLMEKTNV